MVRFAHRDDLHKCSGERAEIVVINSHDRSSGYQIHAAIFRFVCCNGIVVSDATFSRISIPHIGFSPDKVVAASVELAAHVPSLMDGISRMKSLSLTEGEQVAFAEAATIARFGAIASAPIRPITLLQPRRAEDSARQPVNYFSFTASAIRPVASANFTWKNLNRDLAPGPSIERNTSCLLGSGLKTQNRFKTVGPTVPKAKSCRKKESVIGKE
jgi:hypothetical protein